MYVMTLDGPPKTGKSCLGRHLVTELGQDLEAPIRFDAIGDFFRRMTVAVMAETGPTPSEPELLARLGEVIKSEVAFDNGYDWPDLHSDAVNDFVSTVGSTQLAQTTRQTWAERACSMARELDTGLWIVDGRNPRSTSLKTELKRPDLHLILDLFVHTDVEIAAKRSGTPVEQLTRRRSLDMGGPHPLLVYPSLSVPYEPIATDGFPQWFLPTGSLETDVISSTWHAEEPPAPVYMDTSDLGIRDPDLGLGRFLTAGTQLARTALQWYNGRDV